MRILLNTNGKEYMELEVRGDYSLLVDMSGSQFVLAYDVQELGKEIVWGQGRYFYELLPAVERFLKVTEGF